MEIEDYCPYPDPNPTSNPVTLKHTGTTVTTGTDPICRRAGFCVGAMGTKNLVEYVLGKD